MVGNGNDVRRSRQTSRQLSALEAGNDITREEYPVFSGPHMQYARRIVPGQGMPARRMQHRKRDSIPVPHPIAVAAAGPSGAGCNRFRGQYLPDLEFGDEIDSAAGMYWSSR